MAKPGRLWRYLAMLQFTAVIAVLAVLLGLYLGIDLVGEARDMRAGYGLTDVLAYLAATAPARLYDLFPFAILIGTTLMLARLAAGSELVAMRACGFHRGRLMAAVMMPAILMALIVMQVGEWLAPQLELQARIDRERALDGQVGRGSGQSLWVRDADRVIHIGWLSWAGQGNDEIRFDDLRIYDLNSEGQIQGWIQAATAQHESGRWRLGQVEEVVLDSEGIEAAKAEMELESSLDPAIFRALATRPRLMPLRDIVRLRDWLAANNQPTAEFDQAFWRRLLYPLNLLAMVFAGSALMLALGRATPGGVGVFAGVTLGVGFIVAQRLVLGVAPILSLPLIVIHSVPLALFAGIGLWLMRR